MAESETGNVETAELLLNTHSHNHTQPHYNPTPIIEGLLKIITSVSSYEVNVNGKITYSPSSDCIIEIRNEITEDENFTNALREKYISPNYGLKNGLNLEQSDYLRIIAHYLIMDNTLSLSLTCDDCYDQLFEHELQLTVKKSVGFILSRLKKLLTANNDVNNVYNYEICGISIVEQEIYIFDYLSIIHESYACDLLKKYNLNTIFVKFFKLLEYNDDDDHKLLHAAFNCLSLFLNEDKFAEKFVESGGIKKLLKVPRTKRVVASGVYKCFNALGNSDIFAQVDKKEADTIVKLMKE